MPTSSSSPYGREWAVVVLMALGLGLVGVDRFLISTLYPVVARDLHLGLGAIGVVTGALSLAWGVAALTLGAVADRYGRRVVLVGALVAFSLLIGCNGLAFNLASLVGVRLLMGLADGAFAPSSITATLAASPPQRHGRNTGFQQVMGPICGLGAAPLLVAALLHVVDWRWVFLVFAPPGLLLAWLTARAIPAPSAADLRTNRMHPRRWREVLAYRNVRLLMGAMLCWLTCLIVTSAFMPIYLLQHVGLGFGQMSTVMSAIGFGAAAGTLLVPWLSDRTGRVPAMLASAAGVVAGLLALSLEGSVGALFAAMFAVHFFNSALITLTVGPLCSETVPPALMTTASGLVIATGELFGGGLAPVIAGQAAAAFGISHLLLLPIGTSTLGFGLCVFMRETRPRRARREAVA